MKKKKKGFTLIELISVVAIIAILSSIIVPKVIVYIEKTRKVAIQTEAKTIYTAAQQAYSNGILIPTKENTYSDENEEPEFDYIKLDYVLKVLEDNDLISRQAKANKGILAGIEEVGVLNEIAKKNIDDIKVTSDGRLEDL